MNEPMLSRIAQELGENTAATRALHARFDTLESSMKPLIEQHRTCVTAAKIVTGNGDPSKGLVAKVNRHEVAYKVALWASGLVGSSLLLWAAGAAGAAILTHAGS